MNKNLMIDDRDLLQRDNYSTRIPVVLALDTSGSMGMNNGYLALNEGVASFYDTCKDDSVNRYGFDVSIVTFGGQGVSVFQAFRTIWNQQDIPTFERPTNGPCGTPLAEAVDTSMRLIRERVTEYRDNSISHTRSALLFIITDGQSTETMRLNRTDEELALACDTYNEIAKRAREMQKEERLRLVALGIGGVDYRQLAEFEINGKVLHTVDFSSLGAVFESLSISLSTTVEEGSRISVIDLMQEFLSDEGVSGIRIEQFNIDED